jgi:hypothetical protein
MRPARLLRSAVVVRMVGVAVFAVLMMMQVSLPARQPRVLAEHQ